MGIILIFFYPFYEGIGAFEILKNSRTLQYGVKCFLSIGLNNILLVLHQIDNLLQNSKVVENLAHRFGFGKESHKLTDNHCQKLIAFFSGFRDLGFPSAGSIHFVLVEVALLVVFPHQDGQNKFSVFKQ